jgi:hypothetical protein
MFNQDLSLRRKKLFRSNTVTDRKCNFPGKEWLDLKSFFLLKDKSWLNIVIKVLKAIHLVVASLEVG